MVKHWNKAKTVAPNFLQCDVCGSYHDKTKPVKLLHRIIDGRHIQHEALCKKCAEGTRYDEPAWRPCGCVMKS